jgi:hypothetical protein
MISRAPLKFGPILRLPDCEKEVDAPMKRLREMSNNFFM